MFDLTGRVAMLTGGAGMLGRQYTRTLLEAGATVVVADVSADQAANAAGEAVGGDRRRSDRLELDVRDKARRASAMAAGVHERFGRIDILINNAAIDPKFDAGGRRAAGQHVRRLSARTVAAVAGRQPDRRVSVQPGGRQGHGRARPRRDRECLVDLWRRGPRPAAVSARWAKREQKLFKPAAYSVTKAGIAHLTRYLAAYWGGTGHPRQHAHARRHFQLAGRRVRHQVLGPHAAGPNGREERNERRHAVPGFRRIVAT